MSREPAYDGYFADPFLLAASGGFVAYGSSEPFSPEGAGFQALTSADLGSWRAAGTVLRGDESIGTDLWAPEVAHADGGYWMYYSAGFGILGHHLRVARSDGPLGPFVDLGVNLTPDESFAIDPHPFQDADGRWYLFYAHDVLDAERPGTHLAMRRMTSMTALEPEVHQVLQPNAAWQLYEADREMYGRRMDWYTLEGPNVVLHDGRYVLLYSGGSWEGPGYGVSYATAPSPTGPWEHASAERALVLSGALTGQIGPGHNSVLALPDGARVIGYHAWDEGMTKRRMHVARLDWRNGAPFVDLDAPVRTGEAPKGA